MTQRERQASGGVFTAPPTEVRGTERTPSNPPVPRFPSWEEVFRNASPAEQAEWLALGQRQGVLYAHQYPALANGSTPNPDQCRPWLNRLLAGQTEALEPLRVSPVVPQGVPLDKAQCEAVARALHTSDLCLIQGLPGTGKSHVVAEILTRAVSQGERVLFLAPSCTAIDRVLAQVGERDLVCAIRCVGRDEQREALPPAIQALTFAERARSFKERSSASTQQEIGRAEERWRRRQAEEALWLRLKELAARHEQLTGQLDKLRQQQTQIAAQVDQQASTAEKGCPGENAFSLALAAALRQRDQALRDLQNRLDEIQHQLEEKRRNRQALVVQLEALQPLIDAKQHSRWWTGNWWRATVHGHILMQANELQDQFNLADKIVTELETQVQQVQTEQEQIQAHFQAERIVLTSAEAKRRREEIADQQAALRQDCQLIEDKWQSTCAEFEAETPCPAELTNSALTMACADWQGQVEREAERLTFVRQWADCLHQLGDSLPDHLVEYVNLVAATTTSLQTDEHFGDTAARSFPFDLLVLDQAHEVTESEFLSAARRARRWVLVGEPAAVSEGVTRGGEQVSANANARGGRRPAVARAVRPPPLRPGFFQRLWQQLHCDPGCLPYRWIREEGRLCCRLRSLADRERATLESECVADRPEIELRIATLPDRAPFLAEVVFPGSMSIYDAKAYIFCELAELPVNPLGHNLWWSEEEDRLFLCLADTPAADPVPVVLGNGIREMVSTVPGDAARREPGALPWHTCSLEFDRREGWGREKVEEWVHDHLGLRDLGRTVCLTTPHRLQPHLAQFLSDVLFQGAFREGAAVSGETGAAVTFVPVPALFGPRGAGGARPRSILSRTGAGLETDLADPRHGERLPEELRPALPRRGIVNYLEAQAVVQFLESLPDPAADTIGVVALYPAQADLLRLLIQRSPRLTAARQTIPVDVPAAFREEEFATVLVSLTRSHTHRAVTLGESPQLLALALTRARKRLILFGDPGTLVRRGQWVGYVDHLDEASAARERDIVLHLLEYLQGQGFHPHTFHLHEGSSLS